MDTINILTTLAIIAAFCNISVLSDMMENIFGEKDLMPSYEQFNDDLFSIQKKILDNYPKYWAKIVNETEEVIITFPPPKGSNISRDANYKNMFTMVTEVHIRIHVERFVRYLNSNFISILRRNECN